MKHSRETIRIVTALDVGAFRKLWAEIFPHLPVAETDREIFAVMHHARTQMNAIPEKLRCYSHCWLRDAGLPSALPDHMKPRAERMYPVGVRAVGVGSTTMSGHKTPWNAAIQRVMSDAVLETYADGHADEPRIVQARMMEKRAEFKRKA